jgi:hypothetical protein
MTELLEDFFNRSLRHLPGVHSLQRAPAGARTGGGIDAVWALVFHGFWYSGKDALS